MTAHKNYLLDFLVGLAIGAAVFFGYMIFVGQPGIFLADVLQTSSTNYIFIIAEYIILGIIPFIFYALFLFYRRNQRLPKDIFFSFLFFSLGILISYVVTDLYLGVLFQFSSPTVL